MGQIDISEKANLLELEEKVDKLRFDLKTDKMDMSINEIVSMYNAREIVIKPYYQRYYKWDELRKTNFIESILLGIPIPAIFIAENEDGIWEVIDGLQRLTTLITFMGVYRTDINNENTNIINNFQLIQGDKINELLGFKFNELPKKIQLLIKRSPLRIEVVKYDSKFNMKYEIFKRLNTGGIRLEDQEVRKTYYIDRLSFLFEYMSKLRGNKKFMEILSLSNKKKSNMYEEELFLRFLALINIPKWESINMNMSKILDIFLKNLDIEYSNDDEQINEEKFEEFVKSQILKFEKVIDLIVSLEDPKVFKSKSSSFSASLFEAITSVTEKYYDFYLENLDILKEKIQLLKNDRDFNKYMGSNASNDIRVKQRLKIADTIFSIKEENSL